MSKERGIVFCPHFEESEGDLHIPHVQIRDEQMQFFCLYWDYIVQPVSAQLPRWKKSTNDIVLSQKAQRSLLQLFLSFRLYHSKKLN